MMLNAHQRSTSCRWTSLICVLHISYTLAQPLHVAYPEGYDAQNINEFWENQPVPTSEESTTSRSEHGEEMYAITTFFEATRNGTFVELGALNGRKSANTLVLESRGWRGLLIEASDESYKRLVHNRPRAVRVQAVVCNAAATPNVTFVRSAKGRRGAMHGVLEHMPDSKIQKAYSNPEAVTVFSTVPCTPLSTVLHNVGLRRISFFSLDVEGAEVSVLQSVNWTEVQVDVLVVEANQALEDILAALVGSGLELHAAKQPNYWFARPGVVAQQ